MQNIYLRRRIARSVAVSLLLVSILSLPLVAQPSRASAESAVDETTTLVVRARGATGQERIQIRVKGEVVAEHFATTNWQDHSVEVPTATTVEAVSVGFTNNAHEPVDRNLFVDHVRLGGITFESEAPGVYSTGYWASATGCTSTYGESEALHCGGFLHYGGKLAGSTIRVLALGSTGTENLEIQIDGTTRATERVRLVGNVWSGSDTTEITYVHPGPLVADQVRIAFTNNGYVDGVDRNVRIDRIEIDDERFESEHPDVISKGAWGNGARCRVGTFQQETLACNGWLQFQGGSEPAPLPPPPPDPDPEPDPDLGPGPDPEPDPDPDPEPDPGTESNITIWARGAVGTEQIELQINHQTVATYQLTKTNTAYHHTHNQPTTPGQLRVAFTNNAIDQGQDRNVWIDRIELNNQTYESEHPTVTSQGAWANGANCRPGTYNTEFLACNGWFQYADLE